MVFSSLIFLFFFLPAVLILYFCSPRRMKNLVLFLASLAFYAWGEPVYIAIMLLSTATDFGFGLLLDDPKRGDRQRRAIVASSVVVNLGLLSYFKYSDFLIGNVNSWFGTNIPPTDLPLPVGISFYTFQSMSYIIDVYKGKVRAQRNWIDFGTFVALFPQLVAGPIVPYSSIAERLKRRKVTTELFAEGIKRFVIGLAKKVLLANNIGLLWQTVSNSDPHTLPAMTAWLGIVAFAFQIYFDFSGYSDMAIGLGLMFGFRFNENFDHPYAARSITDFWRRWHISLGSWFREYVYIPLGGNRRGPWKQLRNILVVWLLTGFWHGASWNFALWGLYFGVVLIAEKRGLLRQLERWPRWIGHMYALLLILIGWVFFAFDRMPDVGSFFLALAGANRQPLWDENTLYLAYTNAALLAVLAIASTPVGQRWKRRSSLAPVWLAVLFFASVAYLVDATFNPFLYFRF